MLAVKAYAVTSEALGETWLLLQILLDLVRRAWLGLIGIFVELAERPTLPKQIPHPVQRRLRVGQPGMLLGGGDLTGGQLLAQSALLLDELFDPRLDLLVLHVTLPTPAAAPAASEPGRGAAACDARPPARRPARSDMTDPVPAAKPLLALVDGRLVDVRDAAISVLDAGFQSGDAVWEGLRVYDGTVFRLGDHLRRLADSAKALKITLPLPLEEIGAAVEVTLAANDLHHDAHVRLMVTRGTRSTSGMDPRNAPPVGSLVVVAEHKPVPSLPPAQTLRTSSIRRPGPQTVDPGIHHANQLNSILARLEVQDTGVDAALMLDQDGFVAEADTANIFCLTDGRLRTPLATSCLHGITRGIVLRLGVDLDLAPREERLTLFDLYRADEVFLTGTICELVPVTMIDGRQIGTGEPGPGWERLLGAYRDLVRRETG